MKKVLHVIRNIGNGGTENFMMNLILNSSFYVENIVLCYGDITNWEKELDENKIKVIKMKDPNKLGILKFIKELENIIKNNNIDIVYSYTHYNSGLVMLASFLTGVKIRITHSHRTESISNSSLKYSLYKFISKLLINIFSNKCLACGLKAKNALFFKFKKVSLINNGIDLKKYSYDEKIRNNLRNKLNINKDTVVIGTIGRLDNNKNQKFLIDIFKNYNDKNENSLLVIIGDGENKNYLSKYVKSNDIEENVLFLGSRKDANKYYNIFDLFMLTSYKEGLPFVLIEAQANGLQCVVSDSVDKNSNITNRIKFISLDEPEEKWVKLIESVSLNRVDNSDTIIKSGYSFDDTVKVIKKIYDI